MNAKLLLKEVKFLTSIIERTPVIPVLEGILIQGNKMTSSNLHTFATITLPESFCEYREEIPMSILSGDISLCNRMGFNVRLLLSAIERMSTASILLYLDKPSKAIHINKEFLVMPGVIHS